MKLLAALAVAAPLCAPLAACKRPRARPVADAANVDEGDGAVSAAARPVVAVLDAVEVALRGPTDGALVSHELGRRLARCLIEAGDDVVALDRQADPARAPRHARITVALDGTRATVDGAPHIAVSYDATLHWLDDDTLPPVETHVVGEASIVADDPTTAILAITDQLHPEVCRDLAARLDLVGAADPLAGLAADEPALVAFALGLVAARKPPGALAAIVPLLDRPPPVGDAAITAAVALGDRRAVTALTDRVDLGDRTRLTTIIEATIALGGEDAVDFLQVLSSHADPTVARHAREGLARLRDHSPPQ